MVHEACDLDAAKGDLRSYLSIYLPIYLYLCLSIEEACDLNAAKGNGVHHVHRELSQKVVFRLLLLLLVLVQV